MLLTRLDDWFLFCISVLRISLFFSRERMLLLILGKGEMIVLHTRLRENGDLHLWEARTRRH